MSAIRQRPLAVVFDLDGVLLDSTPYHRRAFEEVFLPFGIRDFDYLQYAGWKTADVIGNVLRCGGRDPGAELIVELAAQKSRLAREMILAANPLMPGCVSVLERLSRESAIGLASSGSRESVALFLSSSGCGHLFQSVLSGDDVTCAKPHPEMYQRAFAALNVAPAAAMVVEDAVAGIQSALGAGAGCIVGVEGTYSGAQLSGAGASGVIRGVSDLPTFLCQAYAGAGSTGN
jgi:beta-phosphoglucomutase